MATAKAAVYSEGGNVGPSIINPNIVTTGVVQVNGDHDLTFNGTVTAERIEAFGGTTSIYNDNVTVTDEFIFGNAVAVFNGDYRRNVCEGCTVGMGITNAGSDITFTTFSSNDPAHPDGVDILNLYNGHTIRNGQDNTFNDTKPWSRNGTANIYSLNGFDDSVEFFGTDPDSSMAIQFGAASGANSLVWETPNFMNGGTYPVSNFEIGTDSLQIGTGGEFTDDLLATITINGIAYSATDPGNGRPVLESRRRPLRSVLQRADSLEGDYNENNSVDAADYTIWRNNFGTNFDLPNRGQGITGPVSGLDYNTWKSNFGSGSGPERSSVRRSPSRYAPHERVGGYGSLDRGLGAKVRSEFRGKRVHRRATCASRARRKAEGGFAVRGSLAWKQFAVQAEDRGDGGRRRVGGIWNWISKSENSRWT